VARRKLSLSLSSVVRAVGAPPAAGDDVAQVVLDAAADLMRRHGLGRWSVDDVADAAGVGRTSVYRWFGSRDELVHAVLARELRETLEEIAREAASASSFEERTVEAVLVCLRRLEGSVVDHLLQVDPQAVLPLLTTGAAPLLDLARSALAPQLVAAGVASDLDAAQVQAEVLARLGLSFVLTRSTALPVDDPAALRTTVHALVAPLLRTP